METVKMVMADSWRCSECGRELDETPFPIHLDRLCRLCVAKMTPMVDFIPLDELKAREAKRESKARNAYATGVCRFNRWKDREFGAMVKLLRKRYDRLDKVIPIPRETVEAYLARVA